MLAYHWHHTTITTNKQANQMIRLFQKIKPVVGAFDTETDGLHIIANKPFVVQFGFLHPTEMEGYTYLVDLEKQPSLSRQVLTVWNKLAETLQIYLGHNVKYDLHMLTNIGLPYTKENLSDTMFYIRYAHDALTPKNGGPPLGLKEYATRYIDPKAKLHERALDAEKTSIVKDLNLKLKIRFASCGKPPDKYNAKSYTIKVIDQIFKDPIIDYNDLPELLKEPYLDWLNQDVPVWLQEKITALVKPEQIPYNRLNRTTLYTYAHFDIVYTLEIYHKLAPVVKARNNEKGLNIENSLIIPLYEMERVGFSVNKNYLKISKLTLKEYILKQRQVLRSLVEQNFTISQHAVIKEILQADFDLEVISTGKEELNQLMSDLIREGGHDDAVQFIKIVQELRTLEKWYSAYITRFEYQLTQSPRLYTTINQVGTVSGRVTSDFQQFPKDAILSDIGEEIFHPRKMFQVSGGEYNALVYLDYSQIELRFQAFYTILVGHPDLNLCRAYMPYKCFRLTNSKKVIPFNFESYDDIKNVNKYTWFLEENPSELWTPVDVHGATTKAATDFEPGTPEFKHARSVIGKRVNFAKNYGATYKRIKTMFPEKSEDEVHKIDNAYYIAFPGVKFYHNYCYGRAESFSYTENLFGVRYYNVSGHKLINMLIQGSAAYYLKLKIRELYDYSKANGIKSKWQMQIHDELSWERHKTETEVFFEFQKIMQDWPDTYVPVVAEMAVTNTTWANKKDVKTLEEIQLYLGN